MVVTVCVACMCVCLCVCVYALCTLRIEGLVLVVRVLQRVCVFLCVHVCVCVTHLAYWMYRNCCSCAIACRCVRA